MAVSGRQDRFWRWEVRTKIQGCLVISTKLCQDTGVATHTHIHVHRNAHTYTYTNTHTEEGWEGGRKRERGRERQIYKTKSGILNFSP